MRPFQIFVGYDPREAIAYHVFCQSVLEKSSIPVSFVPLALNTLRGYVETHGDGSNEFIYSRFLVPSMMGFVGRALYADGDMVCNVDIAEMLAAASIDDAVTVVKHDYTSRHSTKYFRNQNADYPRKNWSSVILWNCGHPAHRKLTPQMVAMKPGSYLHRFKWLGDSEIGEFPTEWNWLPQEHGVNPDAKIIHYTIGTPCLTGYQQDPMADVWHKAFFRATEGIRHG